MKEKLTPDQLEKRRALNKKIIIRLLLPALVFWIIIATVANSPESGGGSSSEVEEVLTAAEIRQNQIDAQFSAWDGSHKNLTALIKESMHDPKSYDHNKTAYADKGDYLLVEQSYRGKNAFGGVVLKTVLVKVDMNGAVIEVLNE